MKEIREIEKDRITRKMESGQYRKTLVRETRLKKKEEREMQEADVEYGRERRLNGRISIKKSYICKPRISQRRGYKKSYTSTHYTRIPGGRIRNKTSYRHTNLARISRHTRG